MIVDLGRVELAQPQTQPKKSIKIQKSNPNPVVLGANVWK